MITSHEPESNESRIGFASPVLRNSRPPGRLGGPNNPTAVIAARPFQLTLTASQLLGAAAFLLCLASLSLYLVRYWLFAK